MNLLKVSSVSKKYSDFCLKDISFELPAGYIMGYVGRNGAGKTTTLNMIAGMAGMDAGEIRINNMTYQNDTRNYIETIGYIGSESYFPKEFKVSDIENIQKIFYATFSVEKFRNYMEQWNLPRKKKISQFSRGMKVKLMFACILSRETKLLILDEATNGLDPVMRREVMQLLQSYVEDGEHSILFSTHVLDDLEQIADYIVFIENGAILLNETKDELLEKYLIVKGGLSDITPAIESKLIGMEKNGMGFEALIETDDAIHFGEAFLMERPNIDKIALHHIIQQTGIR